MPGPVIPNPTPDWLKPENASVTDTALTKAMRIIGHLIGADNPTAQVLGLMMTDVPGGSATGGLAKAVEGLKQRMVNAYHGSPNMLLGSVSANPVARQFPNPQSELGAFFTLDEQEAARYADIHRKGVGGRVYQADVPLNNPKELSWNEFMGLKDVGEARAFRQQLEAAGHDGIVVRNTKGLPIEIASFKDVPLAQQPLPFQSFVKAYHGSPHDYAAERLIRHASGQEEYIVGRPDVLPDVPHGATVMKDFPLGRQRLDKIGTGEGAQAFGHGLYEAEAEGTAKKYRDDLGLVVKSFSGKPTANAAEEMAHVILSRIPRSAMNDEANLRRALQTVDEWGDAGVFRGNNEGKIMLDVKRAISENFHKKLDTAVQGKMYEVAIHADPEDFLDWDKPLSQQSEKVKTFMKDVETSPGLISVTDADGTARHYRLGADRNKMTGAGLYSATSKLKGSDAAATEAMKQAGIPGIKYLDQGSRAKGEGTVNYVVNDDRLIDILKKYGLLLPAAGGAGQATISRRSE